MKGTLHVVGVDGAVTQKRIEASKGPSLEDLQGAVGGLIERVRVRYAGRVRDGYVNEEGLLEGLPFNRSASAMAAEFGYEGLVGPLAVFVPDPKK